MLLAGPVAQASAVHEGRRAAAVEVQRVGGAQREQRPGELAERHSGVVARASVARDRQHAVTRDRERGPWKAPVRDVGIKLMGRGGEPLPVLSVNVGGAALRNQQRARLQKVTGGVVGELVARADPQASRLGVDARSHVAPWRVEGHGRLHRAAHPDMPERHALRSQEEPADHGVAHAVVAAPAHERRGLLEHHHPRRHAAQVVAGDVQRRPRAVGQPDPGPAEPRAPARQQIDGSDARQGERVGAHGRPAGSGDGAGHGPLHQSVRRSLVTTLRTSGATRRAIVAL